MDTERNRTAEWIEALLRRARAAAHESGVTVYVRRSERGTSYGVTTSSGMVYDFETIAEAAKFAAKEAEKCRQ